MPTVRVAGSAKARHDVASYCFRLADTDAFEFLGPTPGSNHVGWLLPRHLPHQEEVQPSKDQLQLSKLAKLAKSILDYVNSCVQSIHKKEIDSQEKRSALPMKSWQTESIASDRKAEEELTKEARQEDK